MEKLMMTYLCETYPNAFMYRCKFGELLYMSPTYHLHLAHATMVNQLISLFCCSWMDAEITFDKWKTSRPVMVRIVNSTNENVLVQLETECNTTAS